MLQSHSHRRTLLGRSLKVEPKSVLTYCLSRIRSKAADEGLSLLEVGLVLQERVDTRRAEEDEHIVAVKFSILKLLAYSAVHDGFIVLDAVLLKIVLYVICVYARLRKEVRFAGMTQNLIHQSVDVSIRAEEHLALPVLYILLNVESNQLGDAEILQSVGNIHAHLVTKVEEMIDSVPRREDNGSMIGKNGYFLSTEFFRTYAFDRDELLEINLYVVFLSYLVVVLFSFSALWLRH